LSAPGWRRYATGRRWRELESGAVEVEGQGVITSGGQPLTARALLLEHGDALRAASARFDVPIPWLVGMTCIESLRLKASPKGGRAWSSSRVVTARAKALAGRGLRLLSSLGYSEVELRASQGFRRDVVSVRYEAGFLGVEDTPGLVSAGLMQTLLSTARAVARAYPDTAPLARNGEPREPHLGDLIDPAQSLMWGAGYLAMLRDEYSGDIKRLTCDGERARGFDFVLATGAYNAGGIYHAPTGNPFQIVTYSNDRTTKGVEFYNDCFHKSVESLWR